MISNSHKIKGDNFRHRRLNWEHISSCRDIITMEMILANPSLPWDWNRISQRHDITWDIILTKLDKNLNWFCLSKTLYTSLKVEYAKRHIAAFIIQLLYRSRQISLSIQHIPSGKE